MCGIFGYTGATPPDPDHLAAAALAAGRRGPHGHGWISHGPAGTRSECHHIGPIDRSLPELRSTARHHTLILGHTRLASFGDHAAIGQLQPVTTPGGHAIAHNGCIYNAADLADSPDVRTDSQALAAAYDRIRRTCDPEKTLRQILASARQEAWAIAIADTDGDMYLTRRYHPLYTWDHGGGTYICSWPVGQHAEQIHDGGITYIRGRDSAGQNAAGPPSRP